MIETIVRGIGLRKLGQRGWSVWANEGKIEGRDEDDLRGTGNHSGEPPRRHPRSDVMASRVRSLRGAHDAWDVTFTKG